MFFCTWHNGPENQQYPFWLWTYMVCRSYCLQFTCKWQDSPIYWTLGLIIKDPIWKKKPQQWKWTGYAGSKGWGQEWMIRIHSWIICLRVRKWSFAPISLNAASHCIGCLKSLIQCWLQLWIRNSSISFLDMMCCWYQNVHFFLSAVMES